MGRIWCKGVVTIKAYYWNNGLKMYHGILVHHAVPGGLDLIGEKFVLQEDNDPKHASKLCRNYLGISKKMVLINKLLDNSF